ncbi:MAG: two-component sensor histidine kinase [Moraxellaceae bacterium]|jgi:signal transduction histidine kinase|nr:two-component sensor histidine kinase [Moraxellaceae bacterium]
MHDFHDDPGLSDLLTASHRTKVLQILEQIVGTPLLLLEQPEEGAAPVEFNLEALAWLRCPGQPAAQQPAAQLLEFVLYFVGKYRLAANLHRGTTEASFTELQQQNTALRESEERYRDLSQQLQQRVDSQVTMIEQTQQQLYESARLRSVGQLAAGVAHEINNPVGFISSNMRVAGSYLEELREKLPQDEAMGELLQDFRALLDESLHGAARIAAIVADLKIFSNINRADFTYCNPNVLLTAACNLLQAEHAQQLAIEIDLGEVPDLRGYPATLSQALYNLLDNAARALGNDGVIRVSTRCAEDVVEVTIHDNGCGIAEAIRPRIFDPFFSTRGVGGGIGLGLTVARDIVRAHRGELAIDSEAGHGTCVRLRLPVQ